MKTFIADIEKIRWFYNAGELSNKYTVAFSFIDAWDTCDPNVKNIEKYF
jgi:hypothetical protein